MNIKDAMDLNIGDKILVCSYPQGHFMHQFLLFPDIGKYDPFETYDAYETTVVGYIIDFCSIGDYFPIVLCPAGNVSSEPTTHHIPPEYINEKIWILDPALIIRKVGKKEEPPTITYEGMWCIGCESYSEYSVPNLKDGQFACYSCRTSNPWKFDL